VVGKGETVLGRRWMEEGVGGWWSVNWIWVTKGKRVRGSTDKCVMVGVCIL
jgi:hypothetical protein